MTTKASKRYLAIAAKLKAQAGVTKHRVRTTLAGYASHDGTISAPKGRSRRELYIVAHECAHLALNHFSKKKPRYLEEFEAERWAHAALRRHGVPVSAFLTEMARQHVTLRIIEALRRRAKYIDPDAEAFAKGQGSAFL